jgi:ATP-binding cassette subfamily F protein uup
VAPAAKAASAPARPATKAKLSYKEQRELDELPARIEALEAEQAALSAELADGSVYSRDPQRAMALNQRNGEIEEALMAALERWELLGSR